MKTILLFFFSICMFSSVKGQLKFIIEDFEGFADHPQDLNPNGVFTFGNAKALVDRKYTNKQAYSGERCLKLTQSGALKYGGWGKGVGLNIELDPSKDYLNFYVYQPGTNNSNSIKIELQEDDNGNGVYEKDQDDVWSYSQKLETTNAWKLISIPLVDFKDGNNGGDGAFNISYKKGKLLCFIITFENSDPKSAHTWSFDFIAFSKGKLPTGASLFDAPSADANSFCSLGAWSKEGNVANFSDIGASFENNFKAGCSKKLGVIHFFQPFAVDGGNTQNFYPSVERVNKIIKDGYIPLVTLEDHFVNAHPTMKQPNLYSIVEGHFDSFFANWAKEIKQVDGVVLLRILHEFNGNWYPWCIANNDKDPKLLIRAYRHIHDIFKAQNVSNVRFIWCPNSMSFPQESWNYIMDAYPGDEYVDYVGLDIYNGAGKDMPVWRSFRKEGIENYFVLTELLPSKPLLICEVASRERKGTESATAQNKSEWIKDMSEALSSDMSKVKLLTWFNEKETFKVNSSPSSQKAFLNYVMKSNYFKSGTQELHPIIK
ncbi:MAG TPA: glycosyl hydrolase [Bacteroidia bacterium]|jgi:beta-mannanase